MNRELGRAVAGGNERIVGRCRRLRRRLRPGVAARTEPLDGRLAGVLLGRSPSKRDRNIATRAVVILRDWAFADLGLHRLWLMHSSSNKASCKLACVSGFTVEGTMREALLHSDGWHDMHIHGQLARHR